ncbi:hypothetical protein Pmar_PMAR024883 [Perkinsus marinus ATCC 50983]|uniref:Uncharacterized protein n=1 Tax=Perkinsus marinus (strain ATCC 50983 / TXsc) TaxID=423536 RepID=C5LCW7_PERM5|nr:hypothetical protein Pmar_PMAR024883 [Perkinsus marinus ATCC 50983]EER05420.1 hypothetical protein Pmar_PMAR024883 [Perkinsus marinus ATCC 50983]|eukprot:XP_002773604.1 hypothetical protein Pmar_PMAR024883 [Perkinsus marinus ATCC 50983]
MPLEALPCPSVRDASRPGVLGLDPRYPFGQDSSAEGPGASHYFGGDKDLGMQSRRAPSYSLGDRREKYHMNCRGYWWRPTPGPDAYKIEGKRYCNDFNNSLKSPAFTVGREEGRKNAVALRTSSATGPHVGPGKYDHVTSLMTSPSGKTF